MNIQILGALLRNAVDSWDVNYIMKVMSLLLDENITPSPVFMNYLWQFYSSVNKYMKMKVSELNICLTVNTIKEYLIEILSLNHQQAHKYTQ